MNSGLATDRDPRVRMLGGLADQGRDHGGDALLRALDAVVVHVVLGEDLHRGDHAAGLVLIGLCTRLFSEVHVHGTDRSAPTWWGVETATAMRDTVRTLRPPTPTAASDPTSVGSQPFVLALGLSDREVLPDGWAFPGSRPATRAEVIGIGGSDWIAGLAATPLPSRTATHGLGLHAAVCLAVGQLLARALARAGLGPVPAPLPAPGYALDLLTHRPLPDPTPGAWPSVAWRPRPPNEGPLQVALAGVGSVGTSVAALLAGATAPALTDPAASGLGRRALLEVSCVDADCFNPGRNPFRYPAPRGGETGAKAAEIAARLQELGLRAHGHHHGVGQWTVEREKPGFEGILVSSVDTVDGRLEVGDALARETLSVGVAGLALHVQREHLGDGYACPFCDFVDAAPAATQAEVHAQVTGLSLERILMLLTGSATLDTADVAAAVAAGKLAVTDSARYVGARLPDLVRGAYAEAAVAPVPAADGAAADGGGTGGAGDDSPGLVEAVAVSAPHVSWFAGTLAAVEIVKELGGLPRLDRRVDVDLAGLPPGAVRRRPPDRTGRCVCHSAVRRRWMRRLYP